MANSYLNRTPSSAGNRKKFTISFWVKRSGLGSSNNIFSATNDASSSNARFYVLFGSGDTLLFKQYDGSSTNFDLTTNRVFRDINAWYHIVYNFDSDNGTADLRQRIWVNGVEETSFSSRTNPSSSYDSFVNQTKPHNIGNDTNVSSRFFNGYISHFSFVDGQALAPTVFGETDSTSGIWKFKSPSGVTWGTNGFHLKFENSAALGTDSSGNTNTFTVNGNLKQALDTPSNVYATLNSLINPNGATLANGNTHSSKSSAHATVQSTIPCGYPNAPSTAKFYWECKMEATDGRTVGLVKSNMPQISSWYNDYLGQNSGGDGVIGYYLGTYVDGTQADVAWNGTAPQVTISGGWSAGDILVNAYDASTGKYWQGKNGVWFTVGGGVGNPATGAYPLVTLNATDRTHDIFPADSSYDGRWSWNFGNGYFKTTAITSAGSNGNGSLFEYDVPSGYYALNTKNINTYG
jgi:hypothetical protein